LEFAPDIQADIDCLKQLFPAHVERISQISPYHALVLSPSAMKYAHGKPRNFYLVEAEGVGNLYMNFWTGCIGFTVSIFHMSDDRTKDHISQAVNDFPHWLQNIHGLRITESGSIMMSQIRIELPIGVLPVFYESLVETKLFKYIKVLYFKLLEAQKD
jgi:hypothetical protein